MEISAELKGHFLRLYQLAMTDGNFSPEEWKFLYKIGEERGVSKEDLNNVLLTTSGTLAIPETVEKRIEYLFDFSRMRWADGKVVEDEITALKKYCKRFEFLDENIEGLVKYLLESVKKGKTKEDILSELK